jgi:hypothetical protein
MIVKYDSTGATASPASWGGSNPKYFNGSGNSNDVAHAITSDIWNNIYVGGSLYVDATAQQDWAVMKFDGGPVATYATTTINGSTGYIQFATTTKYWNGATTTNYLVELTASNLQAGDTMTMDFYSASTTGVTSGSDITITGDPSSIVHSYSAGASPTVASTGDQKFYYNQSSTYALPVTITATGGNQILGANELRLAISTSTCSMRFDTSVTSLTMLGTAWGDDITTSIVSYEGGGGGDSVMVISVQNDFEENDYITVSNFKFTNFTGVNAAANCLVVFTGGQTDYTADATDSAYVTITGQMTRGEHTQSQQTNQINTTAVAYPNTILYRFRITNGGENANVSSLVLNIADLHGIWTGDISSPALFIDYDGQGDIDGGDTQVGGTGVVSTSTITFSSSFTATTTRDYLFRASLNNIFSGDGITLKTGSINSTGVTTAASINESGNSSYATHIKITGVSGPQVVIGGDVSAGTDLGGGGGGGGEIIGTEPGFMAPTTDILSTGWTNTWTNPSYAYSSDETHATLSSMGARDYYNFGFSVPSNAVIDGIEVKLEAKGSTAAGTIRAELSWNNGVSTTTVATTTGTLTTYDKVWKIGGPSYTWGRSWAYSEFTNANFRLRLVGNPSSNTISLDALQVRVYYHIGGGGGGGGGGLIFNDQTPEYQIMKYFAALLEKMGLRLESIRIKKLSMK